MDSIVKTIPDFFKAENAFYEVRLGKKTCDVILVKDNEVIAIEVKSASDNISRAVNQTKYYSLWANRTYLAHDGKHHQKVKRLFKQHNKIGLLEYSNGVINIQRQASFNSLDFNMLLSFTSYKYLCNVARKFAVDVHGTKKSISQKLSQVLSSNEIQQLFVNYFLEKTVNQDKATKQFGETEQSYPLKQFLGG